MPAHDITLSVVSHGQNRLVNELLQDVARVCADRASLVLTQNVPDPTPLAHAALPCPAELIVNERIKGYGANHNAAFERCRTPWFCVVNPDIRLPSDPFPVLLDALADGHAGAAGPLVRSPTGTAEDSARRFPTFGSLAKKFFVDRRQPDYAPQAGRQPVDWIAGMFMLFRSDTYRAIGGFDEAYFLYYEDVDLCRRLGMAGKSVLYEPAAQVVHAAQRASRKKPRLALYHLSSMLRFLLTG